MSRLELGRRIGPVLLAAILLWTLVGFAREIVRAREASSAARKPGAPPLQWRFESPEVRQLGALLGAAAPRIGDAGPVVFEARAVRPEQERFVYLWAQFLRPELELVLVNDLGRRPVDPTHWLTFGPRATPPPGSRRRVPLRGGTLFVLR